MPKFIYNIETGTLHIEGYCCNANQRKLVRVKIFDTFDEAIKYDQSSVRMCKLCKTKQDVFFMNEK